MVVETRYLDRTLKASGKDVLGKTLFLSFLFPSQCSTRTDRHQVSIPLRNSVARSLIGSTLFHLSGWSFDISVFALLYNQSFVSFCDIIILPVIELCVLGS